jgi:hypothetical protein
VFKNKEEEYQELFDNEKDIENRKDLCSYIGDFFEEASAQILKADRLRNARYKDINPDLANKERSIFYESKASNKTSGGAAVKVDQLNCYLDFTRYYIPDVDQKDPIFNVKVFYIFWFYELPSMKYKSQKILRRDLAECDKELYLLSVDAVNTIVTLKPNQICTRVKSKQIDDFALKIGDEYVTEYMTAPFKVYDQVLPDMLVTKVL